MQIGKIFSKLVRHVPESYSQPIMPRRDVWSLSPSSPWAFDAATHCHHNHKAAAGSDTPFSSAEYQNSHRRRPMQSHQHCHLTEWKVLSSVLSLKLHQSLLVLIQLLPTLIIILRHRIARHQIYLEWPVRFLWNHLRLPSHINQQIHF